MKKIRSIYLFVAVLLCLSSAQALAVPLFTDSVRGLTPVASEFVWLADPEEKYTIDTIQSASEFQVLQDGFPIQLKGPIWLRLSLAKSKNAPADKSSLLLNLGSFPPGAAMLYKRADLSMLSSVAGLTQELVEPNEDVFLPAPGLTPENVYIRLRDNPGLWFYPVVKPAWDAAAPSTSFSSLLPLEWLLPALLAFSACICFVRAILKQTMWPFWAALFLVCSCVQALYPYPVIRASIDYEQLPVLLAPGMALLLLPQLGRAMLQTYAGESLKDGLLFVYSLLGVLLCLMPLLPQFQWLYHLLPLWGLLLLPILPLAFWAITDRRPGALAFAGACIMPFIGAMTGLIAILFHMQNPLAPMGTLWGVAVGGIGLCLAKVPLLAKKEGTSSSLALFSPPTKESTAEPLLPTLEPASHGVSSFEGIKKEEKADDTLLKEETPVAPEKVKEEATPLDLVEFAPQLPMSSPTPLPSDNPFALLETLPTPEDISSLAGVPNETVIKTTVKQEKTLVEPLSVPSQPQEEPEERLGETKTTNITTITAKVSPSNEAVESEHSDAEPVSLADLKFTVISRPGDFSAPADFDPSLPELKAWHFEKKLAESAHAATSESVKGNRVISLDDAEADDFSEKIIAELESVPAHHVSLAPNGKFVFNLRDLIEDVHSSIAPLAKAKGLAFTWIAQPELPALLEGEAPRLRQALFLLLQSAVQATATGSVELSVQRHISEGDNCSILFTIADSGAGQRSEAGFFHAWDLASRTGGTFAVKYAAGHGPYIQLAVNFVLPDDEAALGYLTEKARKKGEVPSRVDHVVPDPPIVKVATPSLTPEEVLRKEGFLASENEIASKKEPASLPGKDDKVRIIIVDMTTSNMRLIVNYLRELVYEHVEAKQASAVVPLLQEKSAELIIFDADMPEEDIVKAISGVRKEEGTKELPPMPILALVSHKNQVDRMLHAGCTDVLAKPFTQEELVAHVTKCVPALKHARSFSEVPPKKPLLQNSNVKITNDDDYLARLLGSPKADPNSSASELTHAITGANVEKERDSVARVRVVSSTKSEAIRVPKSFDMAPGLEKKEEGKVETKNIAEDVSQSIKIADSSRLVDNGSKEKKGKAQEGALGKTTDEVLPFLKEPEKNESKEKKKETTDLPSDKNTLPQKNDRAPGATDRQTINYDDTLSFFVRQVFSPSENLQAKHVGEVTSKESGKKEAGKSELVAPAKEHDKSAKLLATEGSLPRNTDESKKESTLAQEPVVAGVVSGLSTDDVTFVPRNQERKDTVPLPDPIITETNKKAAAETGRGVQPNEKEANSLGLETAQDVLPLPGIDGQSISRSLLAIIPSVIKEFEGFLADAAQGEKTQNAPKVKEAAENLAERAERFSLDVLAKIARCVERAAEAGDLEAVSHLMEDLHRVTRRYIEALERCYQEYAKKI